MKGNSFRATAHAAMMACAAFAFTVAVDRLGIAAEMRPKLRPLTVEDQYAAIQKGELDLAASGMGVIMEMPGADSSRELVRFMASPAAAPAFDAKGMERVAMAGAAFEPDPQILSYRLPADLKWNESLAYPGLRNAVLYGDPGKPGPYAVRNRFAPNSFSRPHYHPNDRIIVVLSGTWWIGTGEKFDPDSTKPMPPGSVVVHYGGKIHYDGAKDDGCEIIIYGNGPATSTRVGN